MKLENAKNFAHEWINAWNEHDLERILSHYTEDFEISTPLASVLLPKTRGFLKGKNEIRSYWKIGLEKIPELNFELLDLLTGVESISLYYINRATNKKAVEIMQFDNTGKINKVIVNYAE